MSGGSIIRPPSRRDWPARFLELVRQTGNTRLSADGAGVDRTTPYARAARDPRFAAQWAQAQEDAVDVLEAEARRRALSGSDAILMFLLRALRPDRYRDSIDVRLELRREAERIAVQAGLSADELLEEAERRAAEFARR